MDLIERVGSYVGLASFLGLAILALLYFSQARDVRRLRDWAGRAPERATDVERTTQAPATQVPPALPASQHSLPATPFAQATLRKRKPLRERVRNIHIPPVRYLALTVAGVLVLGGAAYGAVQLIGGNDSNSSSGTGPQPKQGARANGGGGGGQKRQVNVDPSRVTVAILNGTSVQGLAAKIGEEVRAGGFTLGTIGNAARIDQGRSEVLYRKGQAAAARAVANRLGIQQIAPVDQVNSEIAGSFDVIVLVGSDRQ
jgi:LytR cell envelope-related transcriptional attenuator